MPDPKLALLAAIVESSDDAIVSKTLDGIVTSWNRGAERMFGYSSAEMVGRPIITLFPADRLGEEAMFLKRLERGERIDHYETVRIRKDGCPVDVSVTLSPLRGATGRIVGASKIARDISERKRAEALLHAQAESWRVTLSSIGDAVIATDVDGRVTFMNGVAEALTGWPLDEARSRPLADAFQIVNEHTRHRVEHPVARVLKDGVTVGLANHTVLVARDGTERAIDDSAAPMRDANGLLMGVVLVFRDVTEQRRFQDAIAEQREWFRVTVASIGDGVIATDADGRVALMNDVAQSLTGWTKEEASGRPLEEVFNIVNDQTRERVGNPALRAIREGKIVGLANHTVLITKHGTDVPIDDSGAPIKDADGRVIGAVLVFRDITERRRAEDRFRLAVESAPNAMVMVDPKGQIALVNSETERLFGYSRGELIGRPVEILVPERLRDGHPARRAAFHRAPAMRAMGAGRDLYGARKDGSEVPIEIGLNPLVIGGETLVLSSIVDITERKQAERRQELQHAATRVLAETGTFPDAVPEVLRLIGEELGWDMAAVWTVDRDAHVLRCVGSWRRPEAKVAAFEASTRQRTFAQGVGLPGRAWATGEPLWLADAAADGDFLRASDAAAEGIHGAVFVPILVGRDPTGVIEVLSQRVQPRDPDILVTLSSVANRIGHFLERQRVDEERTQLLAREREARHEAEVANRTKDDFLAMLSHELRTPLTTILGWAQMLRTAQTPRDQLDRALASIERNARLQARLIEDLLDVSRIVSGKLTIESQRVDMADVVDASVEAVRGPAAAAGIDLVLDIDRALPPMVGDPVRLQQVVGNLLSNAIKFTAPGGRVTVRLRQVNGTIEMVVEDDGRGIRRELLPHVFDRFRQGEPGGSGAAGGLGLGLTIVRYLVERHGGTIEAASPGDGQGATFTVRLPVAHGTSGGPAASLVKRAEESQPAGATLAGVKVLLVEDDTDTLRFLEAVLRSAHAEAWSARSMQEARDALDTRRVDVIVSDSSMPGGDGHALIGLVRATEGPSRRLVAVALTAHAGDDDRVRALAVGFDAYIAKPVDPAELIRMIAGFTRRDRRAE